MTYYEKLKDPRWQRKRLETLERFDWKCYQCGGGKDTLHVHHRYYVSGRDPWEYPGFCLIALCKDCHKGEEGGRDEEGKVWTEGWELILNELFPIPQTAADDVIAFPHDIALEIHRAKERGVKVEHLVTCIMSAVMEATPQEPS